MMEKLKVKETIIVEGKYDRERVRRVCDASVICTDGFRIFKSEEKIAALRNLAETTGIIVLTDSDRAGFVIRSYIKNCLGDIGGIKHVYIPSLKGKEKRKVKPGKEGLLGVEGMEDKVLIDALKSAASPREGTVRLTKAELYADGLSGSINSAEKRRRVLAALGLPTRLSANAMLEVINNAGIYDRYKTALKEEADEENN